MNIKLNPITNTHTYSKNTNISTKTEKTNQTEDIIRNFNLNNSLAGIMNMNYISFKGNINNNYAYLFLNYDSVYNSKTNVLPKISYTGWANKDIYLSESSASAPLTQKNFWKLFSPDEFQKFLKENPVLSDILSPIITAYNEDGDDFDLQDIQRILKKKNITDFEKLVLDFTELFQRKYNIDILKEPKYYRFIGKSELIKLLKGEKIEKLLPYYRKVLDITTNPELNWNQYRVTFKTNKTFSNMDLSQDNDSRIIEHDHKDYRYYLKNPYSIDDIEKLEMASPHGLLEFDLNHKYTNQELEVIDTLMFIN